MRPEITAWHLGKALRWCPWGSSRWLICAMNELQLTASKRDHIEVVRRNLVDKTAVYYSFWICMCTTSFFKFYFSITVYRQYYFLLFSDVQHSC